MNRSAVFPRFHRTSVADQVAIALREGIEQGVWGFSLPSEHELADHFEVSRPSIHAGVLQLAKEGLIEIGQGRVAHIIPQRRSSAAVPLVCILHPFTRHMIGVAAAEDPVQLAIHAELAARGIDWKEVFDARLGRKNPAYYLEKLVATNRRACWVMHSSSLPTQRWFENAGVPMLVLGSCYPGVSLPSVDSDYRAVGWHAAGRIVHFGHRHVAIILPYDPLPGDHACREGIIQYLNRADPQITITETTATPDVLKFRSKLERLVASRERPTVVFTMRPETTQAVFFQLLCSGLRIPRDISLISRDSHILFETGLPEITRYRSASTKKARMAVRIIQSLLKGNSVSRRPVLMMPTFVAGETLDCPLDQRADSRGA